MTVEIPVGRGLVALVDDADAELVRGPWHTTKGANTRYAVRRIRTPHGRISIQMHRVILGLPRWERGGVEVDHINRDGLDNRRSNLRIVSHADNAANRDNRKLPDRPCDECGEMYAPGRRRSRFCDLSCFGKWNMRSRKLGWR